MADLPVYPISAFFAASKSRVYRERAVRRGLALIRFLEANNLVNHKLSLDEGGLDTSRDIVYSDLTSEGQRLMDECLYRWLQSTDTAGREENVTILESTLTKLRRE